ncbi:MAG: hypothetical protein ACRC26_03775, partial [Bacteroidales bacterium]
MGTRRHPYTTRGSQSYGIRIERTANRIVRINACVWLILFLMVSGICRGEALCPPAVRNRTAIELNEQ